MKVAHKVSGSFPRINLNRLQLRGEVTSVLNSLIDDVYSKHKGFDLKSIEIILEGKEVE